MPSNLQAREGAYLLRHQGYESDVVPRISKLQTERRKNPLSDEQKRRMMLQPCSTYKADFPWKQGPKGWEDLESGPPSPFHATSDSVMQKYKRTIDKSKLDEPVENSFDMTVGRVKLNSKKRDSVFYATMKDCLQSPKGSLTSEKKSRYLAAAAEAPFASTYGLHYHKLDTPCSPGYERPGASGKKFKGMTTNQKMYLAPGAEAYRSLLTPRAVGTPTEHAFRATSTYRAHFGPKTAPLVASPRHSKKPSVPSVAGSVVGSVVGSVAGSGAGGSVAASLGSSVAASVAASKRSNESQKSPNTRSSYGDEKMAEALKTYRRSSTLTDSEGGVYRKALDYPSSPMATPKSRNQTTYRQLPVDHFQVSPRFRSEWFKSNRSHHMQLEAPNFNHNTTHKVDYTDFRQRNPIC
eukprot:Platyproteum_vivax@DN6274_c0_g1_i1.p1